MKNLKLALLSFTFYVCMPLFAYTSNILSTNRNLVEEKGLNVLPANENLIPITLEKSSKSRAKALGENFSVPVLLSGGGKSVYNRIDPVFVDPLISLTDPDNSTQHRATINITNFYVGDVLNFVNSSTALFGDISVYSYVAGELTLVSNSYTATNQQWENALRAVTYQSTIDDKNPTKRNINLKTYNGTDNSNILNTTVYFPDFVTTWDLSIAGSNLNSIIFNRETGGGGANYFIKDLSDNSIVATGTMYTGNTAINIPPLTQRFELHIEPDNFQRFYVSSVNDYKRITNVNQWGGVIWRNMADAFSNCENLNVTATDIPNLINVTNLNNMFNLCINLIYNPSINNWNTSNVTTMVGTFGSAKKFDQNIGSWNTGKVTNFNSMFSEATIFNQDISNWNTSKATSMYFMFYLAIKFNQDIGKWDVSKVYNFGGILNTAKDFNQNLGNWNLSSATIMGIGLLRDVGLSCRNLSLTLIGWAKTIPTQGTLNIISVDTQTYSDDDATDLAVSILTTKKWNINGPGKAIGVECLITPVITLRAATTEYFGSSPVSVDLGLTLVDTDNTTQVRAQVKITNFVALDQLIFNNTSTVTFGNISGTYNAATGVLNLVSIDSSATIAQWQAALRSITFNTTNTNKLTRTISFTIFDGYVDSNIKTKRVSWPLFITKWDMSKPGTLAGTLKNITFDTWAQNGPIHFTWRNLTTGIVTPGVIPMGSLNFDLATVVGNDLIELRIEPEYLTYFKINNGSNKARLVDVLKWGGVNWNTMANAFEGAVNLNITTTEIPDLSNVLSFSSMFLGCANLTFNTSINAWNTTSITDMSKMFYGAAKFNRSLANWDTQNVTDMSYMFRDAKIYNMPMNNWNVQKVSNLAHMFNGAEVFNSDITSWLTPLGTDFSNMFNGAKVFNQNITNWNLSEAIDLQFMFAQASAFNQNVGKWNVSKAEQLGSMFQGATVFNQDLGNWKLTQVTNLDNGFISNTSMSCVNMSRTLVSWSNTIKTVPPSSNIALSQVTLSNDPATLNSINKLLARGWVVPASLVGTGACLYLPVIAATLETTQYANAGPVQIQPNAVVTDFDNSSQEKAEVKITNFIPLDLLNFTNTSTVTYGNISGVYNATTGVLNLTSVGATATNAQWQAALRAITFNTTNNNESTRIISFVINDGLLDSDVKTKRVSWPHFITKWNLGNNGTSTGSIREISFETDASAGRIFYTWKNLSTGLISPGVIEQGELSALISTVPTTDLIELSIEPENLRNLKINNGPNKDRLIDVSQWGGVKWTTMESAFEGSVNLNISTTGIPNLTSVTNFSNMFKGCTNLTFNTSINNWATAQAATLHGMFSGAINFNQNLNLWNTSNVADMSDMFNGALKFNQNINAWNTTSVLNMDNMFKGAILFDQPLNSWVTTNVNSMRAMFSGASKFNQNINSWNTSNVTNMTELFKDAVVFNQNIGSWLTSSVTTMNNMFSGANVFNQDITNWNLSNVTDLRSMFAGASAFNQNIGKWDVKKVELFGAMFSNATSFNQNLGAWALHSVTALDNGFIENTAMSCINMSKTLIEWSDNIILSPTAKNISLNDVNVGDDKATEAAIDKLAIQGWVVSPSIVGPGACLFTPVIALTLETTQYTNNIPVFIEPNITLTDADNTTQVEAMVELTNFQSNDVLSFVNNNAVIFGDIVATYNSLNGKLHLTSASATATLAQWEAALEAVKFSTTSAVKTTREISFMISDGLVYSDQQSKRVSWPGFITIWDLSKNGTATNNEITFNLNRIANQPVNYTYKVLSTGVFYTGVISGPLLEAKISNLPPNEKIELFLEPLNFTSFQIANGANRLRLNNIKQWGIVNWSTMNAAFEGSEFLNATALDLPNLIGVTDMSSMFKNCLVLNSPSNINQWDLSNVTTIADLFLNALAFNTDINDWNTEKVTNMQGVFSGAATFNNSLSNWKTALVTNMKEMFKDASAFNGDIALWNTQNVVDMEGMFNSAITFNQSIINWNTANVEDMSLMFAGASNFNQAIGNWTTSKVTNMHGMFRGANLFNRNISQWNIELVSDFSEMFFNASLFNQNLSALNPIAADNMSNMFNNSAIDCINYSRTLIGWANKIKVHSGSLRNIGAAGITYSDDAATADAILALAVRRWFVEGTKSSVSCLKPPVVILSAIPANYDGVNDLVVDAGIAITDLDNLTQEQAVVSIINFQVGDELALVKDVSLDYGNIILSNNVATGVMNFTSPGGTATLAQWTNTFNSIYFKTNQAHIRLRQIQFAIFDGLLWSTNVLKTINFPLIAAPIIIVPVNNAILNTQRPSISGTAEANTTLTLFLNNVELADNILVDATGQWSYVPVSDIAEGLHYVDAFITDQYNFQSVPSAKTNFTIDVTKPNAPVITNPLHNSFINIQRPVIAGTAEANSILTLILDGNTLTTITVNSLGNWSYTPTTDIAVGLHSLKSFSTDAANNSSDDSNIVQFTIDITNPNPPVITEVADGSTIFTAYPSYFGTAEANSTVKLYLNGSLMATVNSNAAGDWTFTNTSALVEGTFTLYATATDAATNVSLSSDTHTFNVILSPKIVASGILAPLNTVYGTASSSQSILVSGVLMDGPITANVTAGFEISLDGINYASSVSIGSSGHFSNIPLQVRIASTTPANNNLMGSILLTSLNAVAKNISLPVAIVNKKAIDIYAENTTKFYGTANPPFTLLYVGLVNGDVKFSVEPTASTNATLLSDIGIYDINLANVTNANYTATLHPGTLTILKRSIVITALPNEKIYGESDPPLNYLADGQSTLPGISGLLSRSPGENAGQYQINIGSLLVSNNYNYTFESDFFTIRKANLMVKAEDKTMCKDSPLPIFTFTYNGFKLGDDHLNLNLNPVAIVNPVGAAGNYDIIPSGVISPNYIVSYTRGELLVIDLPMMIIRPDKPLTISKGEDITLIVDGMIGVNYSWYTETSSGIVILGQSNFVKVKPEVTTTYTMKAETTSGCIKEINVTVIVAPVRDQNVDLDLEEVMPNNILSANADGVNDLFVIKNIGLYPNNKVKIFNRNGNVVFEEASYKNDWDGTYKGKLLPEGVYFYLINYGSKIKKGSITLIK